MTTYRLMQGDCLDMLATLPPCSTVKSLDLMRWLCRLITPSDGTVLDPFMGSGSTGCAALLEEFNFIGIEQDPEYLEMARDRLHHWAPMWASEVA